jgi:PhnB protein
MKAINITLVFNGKTEAAFNFYKSVFGTEFIHLQRMKDMPGDHGFTEQDGDKILHVALPVGNAVLMGMDMPEGRGAVNDGNNFYVTVDTSNEEETTVLFNRLAENGSISMPVDHQPWGAFFGMVTDQFGIQWILSYVAQK